MASADQNMSSASIPVPRLSTSGPSQPTYSQLPKRVHERREAPTSTFNSLQGSGVFEPLSPALGHGETPLEARFFSATTQYRSQNGRLAYEPAPPLPSSILVSPPLTPALQSASAPLMSPEPASPTGELTNVNIMQRKGQQQGMRAQQAVHQQAVVNINRVQMAHAQNLMAYAQPQPRAALATNPQPTQNVNWSTVQPPTTISFAAPQSNAAASTSGPGQASVPPYTYIPQYPNNHVAPTLNPAPAVPEQAHSPPNALSGPAAVPNTTSSNPAALTPSRKRRAERAAEGSAPASKRPVFQPKTPKLSPNFVPSFFLPYLINHRQIIQQQPHTGLDMRRLGAIQEACHVNDTLFLFIHQVYLAHHLDTVYKAQCSYTGYRLQAFDRLLLMFESNEGLSPPVAHLLVDFPQSRYSLYTPQFQNIRLSVDMILEALGRNEKALREGCLDRAFPPSPLEIRIILSTHSRIMQRVIFLSHFRAIYSAATGEFAGRALAFFAEEQNIMEQNVRLGIATEDFMQIASQEFGQRLLQLRSDILPRQMNPYNSNLASGQTSLVNQDGRGAAFTGPPPPPPLHPLPPRPGPNLTSTAARPNPFLYDTSMIPPLRVSSDTRRGPNGPANVSSPLPMASANNNTLLPPPGVLVPYTTNPNPDRVALHQALLRNPKPRKLDVHGDHAPNLRLYQYVEELLLGPHKVNGRISVMPLEIPPSVWERRATTLHTDEFHVRAYEPGAQLFRLKCVALGTDQPFPNNSDFVTSAVAWPSFCFASLNDKPDIEFRRKPHYGRDLPADLTHLVEPGHNSIQVSFHPSKDPHSTESRLTFYFGVERICVADYARLIKFALKEDYQKSLDKITRPLRRLEDDDEVSFVDPFVSVDMVDPFMAKMFQTPVRSTSCLHRECFDLETYLKSRPLKVPDGPTSADHWRCPICDKDARPFMLYIDGFLLKVRKELEKRGELDAKAIVVTADGEWVPKFDKEKEQMKSTSKKAGANAAEKATAAVSASPGVNTATAVDLNEMPAANSAGKASRLRLPVSGESGSATTTGPAPAPPSAPAPAPVVVEIDDDEEEDFAPLNAFIRANTTVDQE
jgi:hypothetical protein